MDKVTIKPPTTPHSERVIQLKKELHKYKSICEQLGAVVFFDNLSEEDVFMAWLHADSQWWPKGAKLEDYYYNGSTWEEIVLVKVKETK